ncbi:MAG: YtxH domain-containing protein [Chloroflexi bacterium]|nr:YtxH domain-containing protein [Chloroflexota bacterium]
MAQDNDFDNFVGGFVLGALLGVAAGLLLAPGPGKELRKRLKDQGTQLGTQALHRADEFQVKSQQILSAQKTRFQEAIDEGKRAAAIRREELLAELENPPSAGESIEIPTHPTP